MFPLGEAVKLHSLRKTCKQYHVRNLKITRHVFAVHFSFCTRLLFTTEKGRVQFLRFIFPSVRACSSLLKNYAGTKYRGRTILRPRKSARSIQRGKIGKQEAPRGPRHFIFFLTKIPSTRLLSERLSNYLR